MKGTIKIEGITIILDEGLFAIEFSPNDYHKTVDLKRGQFILKKRVIPKKAGVNKPKTPHHK